MAIEQIQYDNYVLSCLLFPNEFARQTKDDEIQFSEDFPHIHSLIKNQGKAFSYNVYQRYFEYFNIPRNIQFTTKRIAVIPTRWKWLLEIEKDKTLLQNIEPKEAPTERGRTYIWVLIDEELKFLEQGTASTETGVFQGWHPRLAAKMLSARGNAQVPLCPVTSAGECSRIEDNKIEFNTRSGHYMPNDTYEQLQPKLFKAVGEKFEISFPKKRYRSEQGDD